MACTKLYSLIPCLESRMNNKYNDWRMGSRRVGPCLATEQQNNWKYISYAVLRLVTLLGPTLCDPMDCTLPGSSVCGDSPGKNTGVACQVLLQGIFPTEGLNPGLLHCRRILYQLSHQGSPGILEWGAYPFSRGSSQPRNRTQVSCIAGRFFTS